MVTIRAGVGLLARMDHVVVPEMTPLVEFFFTKRTRKFHGWIFGVHANCQFIERYNVRFWFFLWRGSKRQDLTNSIVRNGCMLVEVCRILWSPGHSLTAVLTMQIVWGNSDLGNTEKRNLILPPHVHTNSSLTSRKNKTEIMSLVLKFAINMNELMRRNVPSDDSVYVVFFLNNSSSEGLHSYYFSIVKWDKRQYVLHYLSTSFAVVPWFTLVIEN